ncbi:RHS repeat domain-containing protein [Flavobacterium gelatinilyticum]|uniref:RHS repeat domain-containing protein n=1 Tax=Flavobacterium gelatinilyticum TaxID=3003260 RepID=UPI002480AE8A|nr:RHS repeat-associated core domain-containing protein [Flavobacterium gelatinilyticum]
MISDANKNITAITYNHLNLPLKITFGTAGNIVYLYNAAGQKVQKTVSETGKTAITTDYLGGYQYENGVLKFFPTAEGYAEPSGSSYRYIYQYKDHLGNIRISYDKTLAIKEENNYYPFGLKQEGYNTVKTGVENKYKYNGKERQDELRLGMYDYGARNYDSALGRWMNVDPLAEVSRRWTPYNYAYNNPVINVDPDGMLSQSVIQDLWNKSDNNAETKWTFNNGTATASNGATANVSEDEDGASSSEWNPLTANIFNSYVQNKYGISDKQIGDFAGKLFENAFVKFGEKNFEEDANFEGATGRSTLSRPDAYSDGLHFNFSRLMLVRYNKSVWREVKARNKNISLDKQIKGFIDGIYEEFKHSATKTGAAYLCLVTTSNSNVSPEVYVYAQSKGVQIQHWVSQYRMNGGNMQVDFGYKTGPLNPAVYEFKKPVKL